jgi:hypothetical protein
VARLVGLDGLDHGLEHRVADLVGERGEADELEVREAGLEDEVGRDGELDGVGEERSSSARWRAAMATQSLRVVEAVRPVELGVGAHELVHDQERDLRVAELVQRPEVAMVRQAESRPKRAARRLPIVAANSASGKVPA